jgi:hypothetical protein
MNIKLAVTSALVAFSTPGLAQTILAPAGLTTSAAASDQAALCDPADGTYPTDFTWAPAATIQSARDATPADHLKPRIVQFRTINGVRTKIAVWHSFSSIWASNDPSAPVCTEPFQSAPTQPAPGQPYTAQQIKPYTPAMLQQIADSGCGPFGNTSHVDLFRLWLPGDTFLVYPAVYTGTTYHGAYNSNNNITLHPQGDYYMGTGNPLFSPNNITIRGVTENGIRPVIIRNDGGAGDSETSKDVIEIEGGANDTIENIGVQFGTGPNAYVGQAGIYLIHAGYNDFDQFGNRLSTPILGPKPNVTRILRSHITGFDGMEPIAGGANGIFGDTTGAGTVVIASNEIDHNGGSGVQNSGGAGHGIYLGASNTAGGGTTYDPNYTVYFINNWFHDQYYGHDSKSRAQHTIIEGNYYQGGVPQGGIYTQAEAYEADVPNGGVLIAHNNVFTKNASGPDSNVFSLDYGEEGLPTAPYDGPNHGPRKNSIDISFNTFVGFARTEDGSHPLVPMNFFYPSQTPWTAGFPVANTTVDSNAFIGYCPIGNAPSDFRGTTALIAGFSDLSQTYSLGGAWLSPTQTNIGAVNYIHERVKGNRVTAAVGGED